MRKTNTKFLEMLIITLAYLAFSTLSFAQSPQKMSYQAVIRNGSNSLVVSATIGMKISILQTSPTGNVVYSETQMPATNSNGLVSIEFGGQKGFDAIDWSNGPYFLLTETDPSGGTNFTIKGTSQLLSVPYAIHASTADSVKSGITEADPIFSASVASGITAQDTANWNHKLSTFVETDPIFSTSVAGRITRADTTNWNNKQDKLSAGAGIQITGNVISATGGSSLHSIGDNYQGGIIFWLDATGQHGLIAASADFDTQIQWYNGTIRYTGTTGDGLYAGAMNTAMIVATQLADNQAGNFAAKVCADYSVTVDDVTYGDWYLPSKYELNLMYLQHTLVGASAFYWSSTEYDNGVAWLQGFGDGSQLRNGKVNPAFVRAVRKF